MVSILMIDRDPEARETVRHGAKRRGYEFIEADDCPEGLAVARRQKPDAVILNVPLLDVEGVCRRLRMSLRHQDIPILAISASQKISEVEAWFRSGVDAFLTKPFSLEALLHKIDHLLKASEAKTEAEDEIARVPEELREAYNRIPEMSRRLGDMAEVYSGLAPREKRYRRPSSPGRNWAPVLTGEALSAFHLGDEWAFMPLEKWALLRMPAATEYDQPEKVVLQRSAPPLTAAVDRTRSPIANELYSVVPARGLLCGYLACLFNSRLMDFYLHRIQPVPNTPAGSFLKRIQIEALPVIVPAEEKQEELAAIERKLAARELRPTAPQRRLERANLLRDMNRIIFAIYGFSPAEIMRLGDLHF